MKIIDIGICIDNVDPKGLGRIRVVRYSDFVSQKEKALEYEPWSKTDLFVANPFLPTNINFIPENGQSVKLINYNVEKSNVNVEYIAGPFTSSFDFNGQTFSQQITNTTYGNANKEKEDIIDKDDRYIDKQTEGAFAKKTDFALYGKYGSDVLFTENGLQLRGGKLLSKESVSGSKRKKLVNYPLMSKKNATLFLKKFPKKLNLVDVTENVTVIDVKDIKYLLEYEVNDLTSPTKINFYIYRILKTYGDLTKTGMFTESTVLPDGITKLISVDGLQGPTFTIDIDDVNFISTEINEILFTIFENGFKGLVKTFGELSSIFSELDLPIENDNYPLFFRPTKFFTELLPQDINEKTLKSNILSNVRVISVGPSNGLIWSQNNLFPPSVITEKTRKDIKYDESSLEQSFSALKSDIIYLLSTDVNKTEKNVPFSELNNYEITQEDYVEKIEPNTYSTVRGENLLRLLLKIIDVLFKHKHNVVGPMVKNQQFDEYVQLIDLLKSVENDLLNKSIRIN
jgi:hypothetical protein